MRKFFEWLFAVVCSIPNAAKHSKMKKEMKEQEAKRNKIHDDFWKVDL